MAIQQSTTTQALPNASRVEARVPTTTLTIERRCKQLGNLNGWDVSRNGYVVTKLRSGEKIKLEAIRRGDVITLTNRGMDYQVIVEEETSIDTPLYLRLKTGGDIKIRWYGFEDKQWIAACNTGNEDLERQALVLSSGTSSVPVVWAHPEAGGEDDTDTSEVAPEIITVMPTPLFDDSGVCVAGPEVQQLPVASAEIVRA